MCGIVGYIGRKPAAHILIEGLKKLEYRGYDSFGIATRGQVLEVCKHEGKISENTGSALALDGTTGIGHTRWATHGAPNNTNAHPHTDCGNRIAIVHNGIIENYAQLRRELSARGHHFRSETDTEVIVHLIEERYSGDLLAAVQEAVRLLKGSFAILAICAGENRIIAARNASPLVVGIGDNEFFAASDMTPVLEYTERAVFLEDGDIADLSEKTVTLYHGSEIVERPVELIDWSVEDTRKGGFPHYMLKEIYEQPQAV